MLGAHVSWLNAVVLLSLVPFDAACVPRATTEHGPHTQSTTTTSPASTTRPTTTPVLADNDWLVSGLIAALGDPSPEVRRRVLEMLVAWQYQAWPHGGHHTGPGFSTKNDLTPTQLDALMPAVAKAFGTPTAAALHLLTTSSAGGKYSRLAGSALAASSTPDKQEGALAFFLRHRDRVGDAMGPLRLALEGGTIGPSAWQLLLRSRPGLSASDVELLLAWCRGHEPRVVYGCPLALRVLQKADPSLIETQGLISLAASSTHPPSQLEAVVTLALHDALDPSHVPSVPKPFVLYARELRNFSAVVHASRQPLGDLAASAPDVARSLARIDPAMLTRGDVERIATIANDKTAPALALVAQRVLTLLDWSEFPDYYPSVRADGPNDYPLYYYRTAELSIPSVDEAIADLEMSPNSMAAARAWRRFSKDPESARVHMQRLRAVLRTVGNKAARDAMVFLEGIRDTDLFDVDDVLTLLRNEEVARSVIPMLARIWPKSTAWVAYEWDTDHYHTELLGVRPNLVVPPSVMARLRELAATSEVVSTMVQLEGTTGAELRAALERTRTTGMDPVTLRRIAADYPDLSDWLAERFLAKTTHALGRGDEVFAAALATLPLTRPELRTRLLALEVGTQASDMDKCVLLTLRRAGEAQISLPPEVAECLYGQRPQLGAVAWGILSLSQIPRSYVAVARKMLASAEPNVRKLVFGLFMTEPGLMAQWLNDLRMPANRAELTSVLSDRQTALPLCQALLLRRIAPPEWLVEALRHWDLASPDALPFAARLLLSMDRTEKPFGIEQFAGLLESVGASSEADQLVLLHMLGGGERNAELVMRQFRKNHAEDVASYTLAEAREVLGVLDRVLDVDRNASNILAPTSDAYRHLASRAELVILRTSWEDADLEYVKRYLPILARANTTARASVESLVTSKDQRVLTHRVAQYVVGHFVFWIGLLFVYPHSTTVQALFFWNRWCRRILGLGYVGFLLTWIPLLRRRLLAPFRESLLADAELATFNPNAYFANSTVTTATGDQVPLVDALAANKGRILLQGDSGLGKTMFLRYHARTSKRVTVFLPAERCAHGVIKAIQSKLLGAARDEDFLRAIIYAGALEVLIDGINEVSPDTRAEIAKFMEELFKGTFIVTSQRMKWSASRGASVLEINPLGRDEVLTFLLGRYTSLAAPALSCEAYGRACNAFVQRVHAGPIDDPSLRAIISNPMDLSFVAQLLGMGGQPEMFRLQDQQYELMAAEYARLYPGHAFPLQRFCEAMYALRIEDLPIPDHTEFENELDVMARFKLIVARYSSVNHKREWCFRHEKIRDYFLAQAFLGSANSRPLEHLDDPRFRGVYALLAIILPEDDAAELLAVLVEYAADTKDHVVSDRFVQLIRSRRRSVSGDGRSAPEPLAADARSAARSPGGMESAASAVEALRVSKA